MAEPDRIIGTRVFGGYAITRKIGEGGMGAVYIAENLELRKKLAVKVLLPERLSSASASSRFLAEARAASAINHRNIIEIIDSSQLADGRHYILMEYLDGTTLRRYARGIGPMPVDVALAIMAQVCSGLQAAHDRGIIHRDLKPSNIFLAPQPDNPYFAKVLDFGIAKLDDPNLAGDIETKSHTVAGTPNYMAPEQARALRDVDHRADVYSIGVIIYELLTGRLPYKAGSIGDLTYQQASTTPDTVASLRRDISPEWNRLVMEAIALDPQARIQSARDLAFRMVAATEHGEAIARATASMLFAPSSSSSISPRERAQRSMHEGHSVRDHISEVADVRSLTASLAEAPHPMALGSDFDAPPGEEETRAASPAAIRSSSIPGSSLPGSLSGSPMSALAGGGSQLQNRENPTTLGMSASQVSRRPPPPPAPTPWGRITAAVIVVAAATALTLVLITDKEPGPAASDPIAEPSSSGQPASSGVEAVPTVAPLRVVDAGAPLATVADAGIAESMDASARERAAAASAAAARDRRRDRKRDRKRDGKTSGSGSGDSDGELFNTRK